MIRPIPEVSIQAVPPVLHLIPKLFGPQRADGWRARGIERAAQSLNLLAAAQDGPGPSLRLAAMS